MTPLAPGRVRADVELEFVGDRKVVSLDLVRARERWGAWTRAGWRLDDVEDADGTSLRRRLAAGGRRQ